MRLSGCLAVCQPRCLAAWPLGCLADLVGWPNAASAAQHGPEKTSTTKSNRLHQKPRSCVFCPAPRRGPGSFMLNALGPRHDPYIHAFFEDVPGSANTPRYKHKFHPSYVLFVVNRLCCCNRCYYSVAFVLMPLGASTFSLVAWVNEVKLVLGRMHNELPSPCLSSRLGKVAALIDT